MMELRSQDELVAFGDNFNDIEMILCWHLVPMLSAMGHEPDSVGLVGSCYGITSTTVISYPI